MPIHPYLAKLSHGTDGSNYTDFAGVTVALTPANATRGAAKTTTLDATGMANTYIPSWRESGEVGLKMQFGKSVYNTLIGHFQSNTVRYYKVTFPPESTDTNGSTLVAQGFLQSLSVDEMTVDGDTVIHVTGAVKLSGALTFTQGS